MNNPVLWIVVIVLLVLAFAGAPNVGFYPHRFGYMPSGLLTLVVVVLIILLLTGRL